MQGLGFRDLGLPTLGVLGGARGSGCGGRCEGFGVLSGLGFGALGFGVLKGFGFGVWGS